MWRGGCRERDFYLPWGGQTDGRGCVTAPVLNIYDGLVTKIAPDTMVDKAAMLLSTDSFAPYWSAIGIEADKGKSVFRLAVGTLVSAD
jgi:hypothetical protein